MPGGCTHFEPLSFVWEIRKYLYYMFWSDFEVFWWLFNDDYLKKDYCGCCRQERADGFDIVVQPAPLFCLMIFLIPNFVFFFRVYAQNVWWFFAPCLIHTNYWVSTSSFRLITTFVDGTFWSKYCSCRQNWDLKWFCRKIKHDHTATKCPPPKKKQNAHRNLVPLASDNINQT